MPLHSPITRLATTLAAGALVTAAAVVPALAADHRGGPEPAPGPAPNTASAPAAAPAASPSPTAAGNAGKTGDKPSTQSTATGTAAGTAGQDAPRFYRGVVTARGGLALRSRPTQGSRVVRIARPGEVVWIYCRTLGQNVLGNRVWYLLADGVWSFGSARFIANLGAPPRWC
ncbi:SH3 domain-containing protein [Streptomyces sp. NPDC004065]|uniref:SH3 domain-containing protein n=1 Tax=Streptomyces sp. NPDC004065 TaxID=3364689 RepID=UPI00384BDF5B